MGSVLWVSAAVLAVVLVAMWVVFVDLVCLVTLIGGPYGD